MLDRAWQKKLESLAEELRALRAGDSNREWVAKFFSFLETTESGEQLKLHPIEPLLDIAHALSGEPREKLKTFLSTYGVVELIKNESELAKYISLLPDVEAAKIYQEHGDKIIKIQKQKQLFLDMLPKASHPQLWSLLLPNGYALLDVWSGYDRRDPMGISDPKGIDGDYRVRIGKDSRMSYLYTLGPDLLRRTIQDYPQLIKLLSELHEQSKLDLLKLLGSEFILSRVTSGEQLAGVLAHFPTPHFAIEFLRLFDLQAFKKVS